MLGRDRLPLGQLIPFHASDRDPSEEERRMSAFRRVRTLRVSGHIGRTRPPHRGPAQWLPRYQLVLLHFVPTASVQSLVHTETRSNWRRHATPRRNPRALPGIRRDAGEPSLGYRACQVHWRCAATRRNRRAPDRVADPTQLEPNSVHSSVHSAVSSRCLVLGGPPRRNLQLRGRSRRSASTPATTAPAARYTSPQA